MSKKTDLFYSIIVPVFNVDCYLKQCIKSILSQNREQFELILVDDGSEDDSPRICDEFAKFDKRIKVIHQKNGGHVSARKAGLIQSSGDIILFVDGDDWIQDNFLSAIDNVFVTYPSLDICCTSYAESDGTNFFNKVFPYNGYYDRHKMEEELFPSLIQSPRATCFPPSIWGKAFKRNIVEGSLLTLNNNIVFGEDGATVIPAISSSNSLFFLNEPLYLYRINPNSITRRKKPYRWEDPVLVHDHIAHLVDLSKFDFEKQLFRKDAHMLLNVVLSKFYDEKTYRSKVKDIKANLRNTVFQEAMKNAIFHKSIKAKFLLFCLRHRLFFIFALIAKFR